MSFLRLSAVRASLMLAATSAAAANGRVVARDPQAPGARVVSEFIASQPGAFAPCADLACLKSAEATCTPSHLFLGMITIEGDPVFQDLFVVRDGARCAIIEFWDASQDAWSERTISKRTCPTIEAATSEEGGTTGCSDAEVLYRGRESKQ